MKHILPLLVLLLVPLCGLGENVAPNPSFESGTGLPTDWTLSYPGGQLQQPGRSGLNSVSISGNGFTMSSWFTSIPQITNGGVYALRFWCRSTNAAGGASFGGFNSVYSDFPRPGDAWTNYSMVAWLPSVANPQVQFGQVVVNGSVQFDDVELYRVMPVHKLTVGRSLGAGEKIIPGRYTFRSGFGDYGGSHSRCIREANTAFAGFRWYMNSGSELVHRHEFGGLPMTNATLEAAIWNYHSITDTTLRFDVSTNGLNWIYAGEMNGGATNAKVAVPQGVLPATELFVRLRSTNPQQFSLTQYSFTADVPDNFVAAEGVSYFFEQRKTSPQVTPLGISDTPAGQVVNVQLANPGGTPETFSIHGAAVSGSLSGVWNVSTNIGAGQTNVVPVFLPLVGGGDNTVTLSVTNGAGSDVFNAVFVVPAAKPGAFGNLVSNPSFELGTELPTDWYGINDWQNFGHSGSRCVSFTGNGNGAPGVATTKFSTEPGETYAIHYWTMATNSNTGAYLGGFNSVYREIPRPPENWVKQTVIATLPVIGNLSLVLGGVQLSGTTFFDDVEMYRTVTVHKRVGACVLGAGEKLEPGLYTFRTASTSLQYCDYAGNYSRSFAGANTSFAGFRWYMNPGTRVIHRHELGGLLMTNAVIKGTIWNYFVLTNTTLEVDVSTNGVNWQAAGQMSGTTGDFPAFEFNAPANLFPTPEVHVRFRSHNPQQFSLMDYSFVAGVPDNTDTGTGETLFFEPQSAGTGGRALALDDQPTGRVVTLALPNGSAALQTFNIQSQAEFNGHVRTWTLATNIPAGQSGLVDVVIPTAGYGENRVGIIVVNGSGDQVFNNTFSSWVTMLEDDSYGERLPSPAATPVWWCDGTYKIGRTRSQPLASSVAVQISAARNEYEPFQLALRPKTPMTNVTVGISDFNRSGGGGTIVSSNVTLAMVEYVPVTELYNALENCTGDTPDPLVPLTGPFDAPAFTNSTVWFTVKVPKDSPAGDYLAIVSITHAGGVFTVPVGLKVRNFTLSDATHTANVINVIVDEFWHKPANDDDRRAIWDLYMQNMARHRVTPYMAQNFNQLQYTYDAETGDYTHNFTGLDAALSRYLDDFNFTAFQWLDENRANFGVGGIERYAYDGLGNKIINPAFKPLYPGLVQPLAQHLREKGWFNKAFSFWIDEPQIDGAPATLALVKDGFQMTGAAAPGLQRLLPDNTFDFPKPDLYGDVEIWVPAYDSWSFKHGRNVERQKAGEKVWPYVFIRPFSPWPNNFTDQTASSPRIRFWIGEKLGWDGELYWGINYYFNTPGVGARNPWTTPFVRDAGVPYGNSDGALVYPPVKQYPTNALIAGPFDSVRWEMIREGMEDREYFWVLKSVIAEIETRLGTNHSSVIAARATMTNALGFAPHPPVHPYEPLDIYASRQLLAETIEALWDGRPLIANQPASKSVRISNSEYFQAEAIGWPLPDVQWQHAGTNIPGATSLRLLLSNAITNMAGDYRMIASNISGSITSEVATLTVYGVNFAPQIIHQPVSLGVTNGGRAVFGVAASSVRTLYYQWFQNGVAITGATNMTLVLTNLNVSHIGSYTVTVTNLIGSVTSAPALLQIPLSPVLSARVALRGFRITISSLYAAGQVQYSTNLTDWQVLTNLPPSPSSVFFVDPVTNAPGRFYRVMIPP